MEFEYSNGHVSRVCLVFFLKFFVWLFSFIASNQC